MTIKWYFVKVHLANKDKESRFWPIPLILGVGIFWNADVNAIVTMFAVANGMRY
jgi:hypothetical protein